jgi:flagellar biogenesis protein FliO
VALLLQQAAPALAPSSFALDLLRTLIALLAVCVLLFAALRFLSRRGFGAAPAAGALRVVQRLPLEPRKALYLVAAGERLLLIGTGEAGAPRLIAELPPGTTPDAAAAKGAALVAAGAAGAPVPGARDV